MDQAFWKTTDSSVSRDYAGRKSKPMPPLGINPVRTHYWPFDDGRGPI